MEFMVGRRGWKGWPLFFLSLLGGIREVYPFYIATCDFGGGPDSKQPTVGGGPDSRPTNPKSQPPAAAILAECCVALTGPIGQPSHCEAVSSLLHRFIGITVDTDLVLLRQFLKTQRNRCAALEFQSQGTWAHRRSAKARQSDRQELLSSV